MIGAAEILEKYIPNISLVKGDFRQGKIIEKWRDILFGNGAIFTTIKIRVKCSSGTYMRSLTNRIGLDLGTSAIALSITRTEIIFPDIPND